MSRKWVIKDADGNITNPCIKGEESWVKANFDYVEAFVEPTAPEPTAEEEARMWRDMELSSTDQASQTPDWPNRDNILLYRTALRDWPSTADFPNKKPTLST